jgi:predicted negative regulator of RcsB-dependent stress response
MDFILNIIEDLLEIQNSNKKATWWQKNGSIILISFILIAVVLFIFFAGFIVGSLVF